MTAGIASAGMGVGRGGKKTPVSRLKGGRRVPEPPSTKSSKARAKAPAPPLDDDDDDDPLNDAPKHFVQSGGMTWRMLFPSEQGLRGKAGISSLASTVDMVDVVDSAEYQFLQREREEECRVEQNAAQAKTGDDVLWLSDTMSSTLASAMAARIKDCACGAQAAFDSVRGGPRQRCFNAQRKSNSCTGDHLDRFGMQGATVPSGLGDLADDLDLDPEDLPKMAPPALGSRAGKTMFELDKLQAELDANAFMDIDPTDEGATDLIASAAISELVAKPYLIFQNYEHVHTWMQLWGSQNRPMKMLPGGGKSKRVYVCRHPEYGQWSTRKMKTGTPACIPAPPKKPNFKFED